MKNSSNLNRLLGLVFGAGIDLSNINGFQIPLSRIHNLITAKNLTDDC